jgi:SAM-dependent methyltransferase
MTRTSGTSGTAGTSGTSGTLGTLGTRPVTFLASFLVLFVEVALIRWMGAYVQLLAFFSNFVLLASFLGIGLGCLLGSARIRFFTWFPLVLAVIVAGVRVFRVEVSASSSGAIYFTTGTAGSVAHVESTLLLPVIFLVVVALFMALAQRMAREMAALPPLTGYSANIAGSLAGAAAFGLLSWLELPPAAWWTLAAAAAVPLLLTAEPGLPRPRPAATVVNVLLLCASIGLVHVMARGTLWSPYYKIGVHQEGADTVIDVNGLFHQSMASVDQKEYFYQWPYAVFGDRFENVLVLGAGSGTDVAAALRHGARHVDAVEIDPVILRLGRDHHPDRPYLDPRVRVINDDARHFLRVTDRKYDLVVFALIDSLTVQSSFSGVRLESYMFTRESFEAVRSHLQPDGLLVIYNYFRERWLVDRLANTAAIVFGQEPYVHVHEARAYLGVLLAGPRVAELPADPAVPDRVMAFGQSHTPSPAHRFQRDPSIEPASDDWPFLYLRDRHIPGHYVVALWLMLAASVAFVAPGLRQQAGRWSWQCFLLGAGFMLLETKAITQFALLWGSTWIVASLAIASVLLMALAANYAVSRIDIGREPWLVGTALLILLALSAGLPIGRVTFGTRTVESTFYAILYFSPILCAGLLFGSAIKASTSVARDYGINLLGAMTGGVAEYLSLVTGYRGLTAVIAACYVGALIARRFEQR